MSVNSQTPRGLFCRTVLLLLSVALLSSLFSVFALPRFPPASPLFSPSCTYLLSPPGSWSFSTSGLRVTNIRRLVVNACMVGVLLFFVPHLRSHAPTSTSMAALLPGMILQPTNCGKSLYCRLLCEYTSRCAQQSSSSQKKGARQLGQ